MPILLPSIRILIRIIKGKTILVNKELFNEFFIVTHKNLLDYKMRIVKQEFIRMLKELIKRDSDFINFLWKHSCLILLLKIIKHDDIMVFFNFNSKNIKISNKRLKKKH